MWYGNIYVPNCRKFITKSNISHEHRSLAVVRLWRILTNDQFSRFILFRKSVAASFVSPVFQTN